MSSSLPSSLLMWLVALLLFSTIQSTLGKIQCLDSSGSNVDWWFIIKMGRPVQPEGGYTTAYLDNNNPSVWKFGNINSTANNALYYTIRQLGLYGGNVSNTTVGWAIWNDQTHHDLDGSCDSHMKDGKGGVFAHSKGAMGFDASTGFWLSHSAPGFPYNHSLAPHSWYFPKAQTTYAQHFFCVSISSSDADRFGSYLQYYHNFIYDSNLPSSMNLPNFQSYLSGVYSKTETSITFNSLAGQQFVAIGKYAATNADLYEDYVAPLLKTGLSVQTWCGGTFGDHCQQSYCEGKSIVSPPSGPQAASGRSTYAFDSMQVATLRFGSDALSYPNRYNHAKWAIAAGTSAPWFCSSDINREITQRARGGGSICMKHSALWSSLNGVIQSLNATCTN